MSRPIRPVDLAVRSIHLMPDGGRDEFERVYHPSAVDLDNGLQPPTSRVPGPAGFWSTALWLRAAVTALRYEIRAAVAEGDLVAVQSAMHGRQTGE